MSKPKDPVVAVLHYFETAELALAQQALSLAQATVKGRTPPKATARSSKSKAPRRTTTETEPPLPLN